MKQNEKLPEPQRFQAGRSRQVRAVVRPSKPENATTSALETKVHISSEPNDVLVQNPSQNAPMETPEPHEKQEAVSPAAEASVENHKSPDSDLQNASGSETPLPERQDADHVDEKADNTAPPQLTEQEAQETQDVDVRPKNNDTADKGKPAIEGVHKSLASDASSKPASPAAEGGDISRARRSRRNKKRMYTSSVFHDEDGKFFSFRKLMQVFIRRWFILFLVGLSVVLVCGLYFFFQNDQEATAVLSLNYEQSTQGLTPNGARFSISELRSEQVAQRAIEYAGLDGYIDPQDLIDCIQIGTYTDRGYYYDDTYIATSFYITLRSGYESSGANCPPEEMLKLVIKAYKDVFFSNYTGNILVTTQEDADYASMEYLDILAYFNKRITQISNYLSSITEEDIAFASQENGLTFMQLQEVLGNIESISYADLHAYIWEKGLAKDSAMTIETLRYENSNLAKSYQEAIDEHDIRVTIVDEYQNQMTDSVLIPSYDDMGEYYMARTKTGIDQLAKDAESYLLQANEYQVQIDQNLDMIANIQAGHTQADQDRADQMIQFLDSELDALEDQAVDLNKEYQNDLTHNYLTFQYVSSGILSKLNVKAGIPLAAVVCLVLLLCFYSESRREDRSQNDRKALELGSDARQ